MDDSFDDYRTSDQPSMIGEVSSRFGVGERRMATAVFAAQVLSTKAFGLIERIIALDEAGDRAAQLAALASVLDSLPSDDAPDPLAELDEPMNATERVEALMVAAASQQRARGTVLEQSVSAAEAARRTGRSRQAVERLRRLGRALALRVGNRWRYPAWQLDSDAPGGIVQGMGPVLRGLGLPPLAAAVWLTRPNPALGGETPISRLHAGANAAVVKLAEDSGWTP